MIIKNVFFKILIKVIKLNSTCDITQDLNYELDNYTELIENNIILRFKIK